ncbi:MAG: hypothetical protein KDJ41_12180 [Hyphomicrobiaceae bacterium]|uniref:hypothetical protein n=1 Tax=Amaricoccus sp. TaxID=1872485 RepID=UPI001D3380D1|nr:hypothetical protein [Amaricoccus sp.]MCB1548575.1 hypothetical protein [Hyphomicrobiaceae bacterium]HRW14696.1 hypothetical protein [Amaricoccus sp.]
MSWYEVIKDFQELVGVAVGFIGVILTLLYTAKLARDQRQHEADLARRRRQHESLELGRGLLVELAQMRANIQHLAQKEFKEDQKKDRVVLPIYATPIFDANVQHIGRLPGASVPIVVSAYLQIQRLREFMRSSALDKDAQHYLQLPVAQIGSIQQQSRVVSGRLSQAIEKLMAELGDHGLPVEELEWPLTVSDGQVPEPVGRQAPDGVHSYAQQ